MLALTFSGLPGLEGGRSVSGGQPQGPGDLARAEALCLGFGLVLARISSTPNCSIARPNCVWGSFPAS